jgi:CHAT domain-containing protein
VIANLWRVDDEAGRFFMRSFYEQWEKPGVSTAEALRRARQQTARKWSHPSQWAGWVLWGLVE